MLCLSALAPGLLESRPTLARSPSATRLAPLVSSTVDGRASSAVAQPRRPSLRHGNSDSDVHRAHSSTAALSATRINSTTKSVQEPSLFDALKAIIDALVALMNADGTLSLCLLL